MQNTPSSLNADHFLKAAMKDLEPLMGTHIYDAITRDYTQKTGGANSQYGVWMKSLLTHLTQQYHLPKVPSILDFGCGTGELTVLMNHLGFNATGIDVHAKHLWLARILARENDIQDDTFVLSKTNTLPFEDDSFDIITMLVVLEHLSDKMLKAILPELMRVCRGVLYVLVPNKLQITDDHTGLRFLPWMPRWLATLYLKTRGRRHQYFISEDGSWDVHYRGFGRIRDLFEKHGLSLDLPPDELVFPPLDTSPPICRVGKAITLKGKSVFVGMPLPCKTMIRLGYPKQAFYPYLNLVFVPKKTAALK